MIHVFQAEQCTTYSFVGVQTRRKYVITCFKTGDRIISESIRKQFPNGTIDHISVRIKGIDCIDFPDGWHIERCVYQPPEN